MPTIQPLGNYLEFGTGAEANAGRGSANKNKVGFDTNGYLYQMRRNGDSDSRAAGAPTIIDFTLTAAASRGAVCIQPATSRLHEFAGIWASSVGASTTSGAESDWQWIQVFGSYSAAPLQSGTSHSNSGSEGLLFCLAGSDSFAGSNYAASAQADIMRFRGAQVLGATVASNASTFNCWLGLPLQ